MRPLLALLLLLPALIALDTATATPAQVGIRDLYAVTAIQEGQPSGLYALSAAGDPEQVELPDELSPATAGVQAIRGLPGGTRFVVLTASTGARERLEVVDVSNGSRLLLTDRACYATDLQIDDAGTKVAFVHPDSQGRCRPALIELDGSGTAQVAPAMAGETRLGGDPQFRGVSISRDGTTLAYAGTFDTPDGFHETRLITVAGGTASTLVTSTDSGTVVTDWELEGSAPHGWLVRKDVVTYGTGQDSTPVETTIGVLSATGQLTALDTHDDSGSAAEAYPFGQFELSPDGTRLLALRGTESRLSVRRVSDPPGVWTTVPGIRAASLATWKPATPPPPVIFLPGVLGSEIWCDETAGSPIWPALGVSESFMLLGTDGETNAGTCAGAGVRDATYDAEHRLVPGGSGVAESLLGHDIYGSALTQLSALVGPARFYAFGWDWRRDTASSIARLDALIDEVLEETDAEQVQVVAHSYGGLLALDYASDPTRRAKLARVTTIGTPYLGSPKAVFSLLTGTETLFEVGDVGTMEFLFGGTDDLRDFSRNLRGMFNLWPSPGYGTFLSTPTLVDDGPLDADQTASLIEQFGGRAAVWRAAQAKHAALWDRIDIGDLPWQLVVVGGQPTVNRVTFVPGSGDEPTRVGVTLGPGDGTVPLRSQTLLAADTDRDLDLGVIGGNHPNLGVTQRCFSKHSAQMVDPELYALIGAWLLEGIRPEPDIDLPCRADTQIVVETIDADLRPAAPAPRRGAPSARRVDSSTSVPSVPTVAEAEAAGDLDVLGFGRQNLMLLDPDRANAFALTPSAGRTMQVSARLVSGETSTPLTAPIEVDEGVRVQTGADGSIAILDTATGTTLAAYRPPAGPSPITPGPPPQTPVPSASPTSGPTTTPTTPTTPTPAPPAVLAARAVSAGPGRVRLRIVLTGAELTGADRRARVLVRRGGPHGPIVARGRLVDGVLVLRLREQPRGERRYRVSSNGLVRVAWVKVR